MSDLSDYEVDEFSESLYSEDKDFDIKTETPDDDEEKESTNWLNEIAVIFTKSESSWYLKAN